MMDILHRTHVGKAVPVCGIMGIFILSGVFLWTNYTLAQTSSSTETYATSSGGLYNNPAGSTSIPGTLYPDTIAPSTPTNLVASDITTYGFKISWDQSTDPYVSGQITSGVYAYRIHRNNETTPAISTTANYFIFTNLSPETTFVIHVSAVDASGNTSSLSAPVNVTTTGSTPNTTSSTTGSTSGTGTATTTTINTTTLLPDTLAPSTPTNVVASDITTSSIKLSWTPSTDLYVSNQTTSGIRGYRIYKNNETTPFAFTYSNYYSVTGLASNTTFSFTVSAVDQNENASSLSTPVYATTLQTTTTTTSTTSTTLIKEMVVKPTKVTLYPSEYAAFQAFDSSQTLLSNVLWSILESNGGTINTYGMYKAPTTPGTYTVIARLSGYTERKATVTVIAPLVTSTTTTSIATTSTNTTTTNTASTTTVTKSTEASTTYTTQTTVTQTQKTIVPIETKTTVVTQETYPTKDATTTRVIEEFKTLTSALEQTNATNTVIEESVYKDSNNDGISDYESTRLYNIDPIKPSPITLYDGREITAGEKVLLGFDPSQKELVKIVHEEPQSSVVPPTPVYKVEEIKLVEENKIALKGKALPNSIVTIYIYSTPIIVTVKTNEIGEWEYVLDQEIESGEHIIYTASVNNSGKIVAKSPEFTFIKTAEAATLTSFEQENIAPRTKKPSLLENWNIYIILALFMGIVLISIGLLSVVSKDNGQNTPPPTA